MQDKSFSFDISLSEFANLIKPVLFCVDARDSREALRHVELKAVRRPNGKDVSAYLQAVATDGHRLVRRLIPFVFMPEFTALDDGVLIPKTLCEDIVRMAKKDNHTPMRVELSDKKLSFTTGTFAYHYDLLDARFPDYKFLLENISTREELSPEYKSTPRIWFNHRLMAGLLKANPGNEVEFTMPQEPTDPMFLRSTERDGCIWEAIIMPVAMP